MASRSASCRWVRFRVRRISAMKRPVLLWSIGISLLSDGIIASGRPEEHPRTVEWRPRGAKHPRRSVEALPGAKSPAFTTHREEARSPVFVYKTDFYVESIQKE